MKKTLLILAILLIPLTASAAWYNPLTWFQSVPQVLGAAFQTFSRSILPIDSTENLGTTTAPWDELHVNEICFTADTCETEWPAGGASGGGGAGTFATSTAWGSILYNYPLNDTDIVAIGYNGSGVATSTNEAEWVYDPVAKIGSMLGKWGIGTTSPYAALSVVGEVVGEYFTATSTTATSTFNGAIQAGTRINLNSADIYDQTYNNYTANLIPTERIAWHNLIRPINANSGRERLSDFKNIVQVNNAITGGVGISGVVYVPGVDLLFMVDNNTVNISIYLAGQIDGAEFGNITFSGFSDPEGLDLLWTIPDANGVPDKAVFAVSEEQINQITIFEWDLQSTSGTITKSDWPTIDATGLFAENATLGMEAIAYIPDINSIFTCNQAASECRIIPLTGSLTPAATEPFDAATVWSGAGVPAVNDLKWDQNTKTMIAIGDETGASNANQDIFMFDPYSGTIIDYWNNYVTDVGLTVAQGWVQSEGIAITPDGQSLYITSEAGEIAWLKRSNVQNKSFFSGLVGIGTSSPYAKLSVAGEIVGAYVTATTTATSTLPRTAVSGLNLTNFLTFGGVTGSAWSDFCTAITGGAGLCDGSDASGSGGAAAVATSTNETAGNLAYWTSTSGTPATLGKVATGTLSCSGSVACTARQVIGGDTTVALTNPINVGISLNGGANFIDGSNSLGTAGHVLMTTGGTALWVSTTTFSSGLTYSAGNVVLDMTNPNVWTGLQTFTNSTTTLASFGYASSTKYFGANLTDCDDPTNSKLLWSDTGRFSCGGDQAGGGFTLAPNSLVGVNAAGNTAVATGTGSGGLTVSYLRATTTTASRFAGQITSDTSVISPIFSTPGGEINFSGTGLEMGAGGIVLSASDFSASFSSGAFQISGGGAIAAISGLSGATGDYDFSGGSSFDIPVDKTTDAAGEITIETTVGTSSVRWHDGTEVVRAMAIIAPSFTIASSSLGNKFIIGATTTQRMGTAGNVQRLTRLQCYTQGATLQFEIGDGASWTATNMLVAGTTTVTSFANNTWTGYEPIWIRVRPQSGWLETTCTTFYKLLG